MEPVFLNLPVDNAPSDDALADLNAPFSFLEWKQRRPTIVEKQATVHYNKYVVEWFENNKTKKIANKFLIRQKYLHLLDQLHLVFSEKEKHEWYNKINLMDEKELLISIPYFAKKLKQVALYYLNLRKQLKNTKLKYNTVGTSFGIEQDLYNVMLKSFSSLNDELHPDIKTNVPSFSAIRDSLVIQIEELYDDKDYFDVSPTLPISNRFDVLNHATAQFYQTKGINLSSDEWILNCLNLSADLTFDTLVNKITADVLETTDSELYQKFVTKYLAENKYKVEFDSVTSAYSLKEIPLQQGNNYFYYPTGIINPTLTLEKKLANVSLSSLRIEGASASTTLEAADTVYVKNGNTFKGAWLRYKEHEDVTETVEAKINQYDTTTFIFPYPGYGLSGEGLAWTEPSFTSTPEYNFLSNEIRAAVDTAYWSWEVDSDSSIPIPINSSTLLQRGAIPNKNPNFADRIFLRTHDPINLNQPALILSGAWLYRFENALLPISPTSDKRFLWPFSLIDPKEPYPPQFETFDFSSVCEPVNITNLNSSYSIGSNSIETSDKIYKFSNYSDDVEQATECSWLFCDTENLTFHKAFKQNGFNALFNAGTVEKFVWNGPNNTPLSDVFKTVSHKADCPFVTSVPQPSSLQWEKCSCKQVYYSPFGHPGNLFENNNGFADFIVKDYSNGTREFDMGSWRDITGATFKGSPNVAWYKTNSAIPDWGNGAWVNNNSPVITDPFLLETGQSYYYKRANAKNSNSAMPPYSVSYVFSPTNRGAWMGAKLNEDGEWVSTNLNSNMIIYPGDVIKYERIPKTTQYLISSEQVEDVSRNDGSVWSTFNYIVSGTLQSTVYISWPSESAPMGSSSAQYPPFNLLDIKELYWWKIQHTTIPSLSILIESPFTISESTSALFSTIFVTATSQGFNSQSSSTTSTPATGGTATNASESSSGTSVVYTTSPQTETTYVTVTSKAYNNKTIISFTPPATGVYSISVQAKSNTGTFVHFTDIPQLTVVPQYFNREILIEQGTTSNGFLLEQPLFGWNYNTDKPRTGSRGAKPYWATLHISKQTDNRFKGAFSWGYPNAFINEYIPDHAPIVSPMEFNYGQTVSYERVGTTFNWIQPVVFKKYSGTSEWCALSTSTNEVSNLSSLYVSKRISDLNAYPLLTPTDIQLTNILNGLPVEIFYYANNSFTWTISSEALLNASPPNKTLQLNAAEPWANLNNRFFSTAATIPLLDEVYSETNIGGYFVPQNLGASFAINKDFEAALKTASLSGEFLVEDVDIHIGGRGRTRQDQQSLYSWKEQNQWMKEPPTAGKLAGSVKRNLTKTLQTFVPYEESGDETLLGPVTPKSRVSPWGGQYGNIWTDTKNEPKSFTEVKNVSAWVSSQILKQNKLVVDCWTSDIFGNQYSLFKNLSGVSVSDRQTTPGELWVKTNDQSVKPGYQALSSVFNFFKPNEFYENLIGNGILSIDCFFDTLMLETSGALVFCPLEYNYETSEITSLFDDCTVISNLNFSSFKFERTWLFPKTKTITVFCTELSGTKFSPALFSLNLNDKIYTKLFPRKTEDFDNIAIGLSGIDVLSLDKASLHYNSMQQTYLLTYKGLDTLGRMFLVDFKLEQLEDLVLREVDRYLDNSFLGISIDPPEITDSSFFTPFVVLTGTPFSISLTAENTPANWSIESTHPFTINVNNSGIFTGIISFPGTYYVNYKIANGGGSTTYPLTINAI